jgi:serine/threonine protein kinase
MAGPSPLKLTPTLKAVFIRDMPFTPPTPEQIKAAFSHISSVTFLKQGGFKAVYKIAANGRAEAFKAVHLPRIADPETAEQFRKESIGRVTREVRVLEQCKSPALVKLGSIAPAEIKWDTEDFVVYSEEFLDGPDLRKLVRPPTHPDEAELRLLLITLLKAIQELWALPGRVIHRDIKPDNVVRLNDPNRRFVLLDLGIAFAVLETALTLDPEHRLPPGTIPYLAPEMLRPDFRESLDYRSDIYSAALTVYEYAAGQHPLQRSPEDFLKTLSRIIREPPKPLRDLRPDLSPFFLQTVDRMLKKLPALRPSNLSLLIQQLQN